jgi:RNA polymerase sigma-70 factor (ECF subfamily)
MVLAFLNGRKLMFCKQNDAYQVDAISIEYLDGLYSYALVLSRNHADAEDLVQQTYVRAQQAIGRLRADSNIKSCFFTILRNIWLNQLRNRRSGPQILDTDMNDGVANEMVEPSNSSNELSVSKVEREQVRAAIQKLPVEFREVIVLREYEELSYQEIASIVGCPAEAVMSRLVRGRSKLRVLLSDKLTNSGSSQEEKQDEMVR